MKFFSHWQSAANDELLLLKKPHLIALKMLIRWRGYRKKNMILKLRKSIYAEKFVVWKHQLISSKLSSRSSGLYLFPLKMRYRRYEKGKNLMEKFRTIEKFGIQYSLLWIYINIKMESSGAKEKRTFVHIFLSIFHSRHKSGLQHIK